MARRLRELGWDFPRYLEEIIIERRLRNGNDASDAHQVSRLANWLGRIQQRIRSGGREDIQRGEGVGVRCIWEDARGKCLNTAPSNRHFGRHCPDYRCDRLARRIRTACNLPPRNQGDNPDSTDSGGLSRPFEAPERGLVHLDSRGLAPLETIMAERLRERGFVMDEQGNWTNTLVGGQRYYMPVDMGHRASEALDELIRTDPTLGPPPPNPRQQFESLLEQHAIGKGDPWEIIERLVGKERADALRGRAHIEIQSKAYPPLLYQVFVTPSNCHNLVARYPIGPGEIQLVMCLDTPGYGEEDRLLATLALALFDEGTLWKTAKIGQCNYQPRKE